MVTTAAFDEFDRAIASRSELNSGDFEASHSSRRGVVRVLAGMILGGMLLSGAARTSHAAKEDDKTCASQNRRCKNAVRRYCSQFSNAITCWNNVVPCCDWAKKCKRGKALRCLRRRS